MGQMTIFSDFLSHPLRSSRPQRDSQALIKASKDAPCLGEMYVVLLLPSVLRINLKMEGPTDVGIKHMAVAL